MRRFNPDRLGIDSIGSLLIKQSIPASIGFLAMSLNMVVDTIFLGQWIGPLGIAAVTIVLPIAFLMSSIGMAIGVGGGSIISRALGIGNVKKACEVFGNQILITAILIILLVSIGIFCKVEVLQLFGAAGRVTAAADTYFTIVLIGVPSLAFAMVGNKVIRAEGNSKMAMVVMLVGAILNLVLDVVFIKFLNWGIAGAAWATSLSYISHMLCILYYFSTRQSTVKITWQHLQFRRKIAGEIASLGFVTLVRQGMISILAIAANHTMYQYGGETALNVYGIINRLMLFVMFPIMGITQGFLPIAGYNYGAEKYNRVRQSIQRSILYSTLLSCLVYVIIMSFPVLLTRIFTTDRQIIEQTPHALRWTFAAIPIVGIELIGPAYFQAIGKAVKALFLTALRQGLFLIPLILFLPKISGIDGVWYAFPAADLLSCLVVALFLYAEVHKRLN
ncbi:MAG: MATE family efflux transporter [Flavobacteriales bacterium]